jgi:hypothetical protein
LAVPKKLFVSVILIAVLYHFKANTVKGITWQGGAQLDADYAAYAE